MSKFLSFKYRTAVYCARKKSEDKAIQLDLTPRWSKLLGLADKRAKMSILPMQMSNAE